MEVENFIALLLLLFLLLVRGKIVQRDGY